MSSNRNRLVAPRNVVNTKMLYTFYILKELAKGETIFGNKILEVFRNKFQNAERPFPVSSSTIYETLYDTLVDMRDYCEEYDITKIAMPRIGCGLDQLEWDRVYEMLEDVFFDTDIEILVCTL